MVASSNRRWWALALLSVVQFMIVLDIAIVNVALPSIQVDLGFSQQNLQWVISAYALVFGGFLLLGGRAADLVGRRRLFIVGLAVFSAASLLAALAWNEPSLIGARALQGLGAAIIAPAALSILMTTFSEGKERNIALGVWGAVGGFGAAAGVLLGGLFTDALSWEWIFYINIPVGLDGHRPGTRPARRKPRHSRTELRRPGCGARDRRPLDRGVRDHPGQRLRLGLRSDDRHLRRRRRAPRRVRRLGDPHQGPADVVLDLPDQDRRGANIAGFILGTALFSMFLMLTLYMQQVLGYSAMKTGVAYIAVAGSVIVWSMVAQQLVTRVGVKPVLVTGMSVLTVGLVYFTQVSVGGSYLGDLLPGFLVIALGMGFSFVPISIAALAGVPAKDAGLASGLINTSQQIGGALGIAVLSSVAIAQTNDATKAGEAVPSALTSGFQAAFWVGAGVAAVGVLAPRFVLIRNEELAAARPSSRRPSRSLEAHRVVAGLAPATPERGARLRPRPSSIGIARPSSYSVERNCEIG